MWEKIKAFHKHSETVALAHILIWVSVITEALSELPEVAQSVGLASVVPPTWLGVYTLTIALLTLYARLRRFNQKD